MIFKWVRSPDGWVDYTTSTSTLAHPWKGTHSHSVAVVRFRREAPHGPRDDSRRAGCHPPVRPILNEEFLTLPSGVSARANLISPLGSRILNPATRARASPAIDTGAIDPRVFHSRTFFLTLFIISGPSR